MVLKGDCLEGHINGKRPSHRGQGSWGKGKVCELWGVVETVKDGCRRSTFTCSGIFADSTQNREITKTSMLRLSKEGGVFFKSPCWRR